MSTTESVKESFGLNACLCNLCKYICSCSLPASELSIFSKNLLYKLDTSLMSAFWIPSQICVELVHSSSDDGKIHKIHKKVRKVCLELEQAQVQESLRTQKLCLFLCHCKILPAHKFGGRVLLRCQEISNAPLWPHLVTQFQSQSTFIIIAIYHHISHTLGLGCLINLRFNHKLRIGNTLIGEMLWNVAQGLDTNPL